MKYQAWKMSFLTLIDRKNLPKDEKLHYLSRYLVGDAKKAVEGLSTLGDEVAYDEAWQLLEKRFGDPFIVGKSFRDKLQAWPKVSPKNGRELRDYVDFLKSCEVAMHRIKTLEVLNDCIESQRILQKLPEWLTNRWNRKVAEFRAANSGYPPFKKLVEFLTIEADLACDPVFSMEALRNLENETPKQDKRKQPVPARTLATNTTPNTTPSKPKGTSKPNGTSKPDDTVCAFCENIGHTIYECRKFSSQTDIERDQFAQAEKLCYACLKPGHYSGQCENKHTCDKCERPHPTCMHFKDFRQVQKARPRPPENRQAETPEVGDTGQNVISA